MKKVLCALAVVGIAALFPREGEAISLWVVPTDSAISRGEIIDLDVMIGGLAEEGAPSLGAFDLTITFSPEVTEVVSVSFGEMLGDHPADALASVSQPVPGALAASEVSLLSIAELNALQAGSFSLFELSLRAAGVGRSSIDITEATLADGLGFALPVESRVGAVVPVIPEPSGFLVFLLGGVIAMTALRRNLLADRAET